MTYKLSYVNDIGGRIDFSLKNGIVIGSATGFTENYINLSESQGMMQIGTTIQGQSVSAKNIVITGEIIGDTTEKRKMMIEVISPLSPARLIYNDEWEIRVAPTITPIIEKYNVNARFQFTVRAAYPYWRKVIPTSVELAGLIPTFKFPWNISEPYRFSERIQSLFANVINAGNVPAKFVVYFKARSALESPKITKVSTGEFIRIDKEMEAGEEIIVDMTEGVSVTSVYEGLQKNIFGYLDLDSTMFKLDVGDNIVHYDADINLESLDVRIMLYDTISGVY